MSQDFTKAKIYKITNNYNDDIYVGSTCNTLVKRFSEHKLAIRDKKNKNRPIYQLMEEIGFERFRIQLICDYPCEDKYSLRQKEGDYIRQMGTLNKQIAGYDKNRDNVQEYNKQWELNHKEERTEQHKRNYQEKKGEINEKRREIYKENKEKIRVRVICSCGADICKRDLSKHIKTKRHTDIINSLETCK